MQNYNIKANVMEDINKEGFCATPI